jgi:uncharacterized protein
VKIFIDIGHPAHVHYFRNFIILMEKKGHEFLITARDKEVTFKLLDFYNIKYIKRGKGSQNLLGKLIYMFAADFKIVRLALRWKPDIFISFSSPYAAQAATFLGKPHIGLTDTEHAKLGILSFAPFSNVIVTPESFYNSFNSKHIRFDSFFELCYLLPKYFVPDTSIKIELGIRPEEKYALLRFVSWNASHDLGHSGISDQVKLALINMLVKRGFRIFISSEGPVAKELRKYTLRIAPEKIHSVLKEAELFIGESGTMATESALLGTPSIYINSLDAGVFREEVKYGILTSLRTDINLLNIVEKILSENGIKSIHIQKKDILIKDKIDPTSFLVWFVENYPSSIETMKDNPSIQYNYSADKAC